MSKRLRSCPDSERGILDRRTFLKTTCAAAAAAVAAEAWRAPLSAAETKPAETTVKLLFDSLSAEQKNKVCFAWDYQDPQRGLLRTRISNNWHITEPTIAGDFFTAAQQKLIREIFEGLIQPPWHAKFDKQLQDDAGGWGKQQNIAIFGQPGQGKFEFVLTGRHMTLRCDGNSAEHVAFGGPIFYGHAASGFTEKPGHPDNVFWQQAVEANKVYEMLDGRQRKLAEVPKSPNEAKVGFGGPDGKFPGVPMTELTSDQREQVQKTLQKLIEPYRQCDRDEVVACLKAQGGLEKCSLAFYTDEDLGNDRMWDNWRLEGPAFVWYFRGNPHVHVWVNVAGDPAVALNA